MDLKEEDQEDLLGLMGGLFGYFAGRLAIAFLLSFVWGGLFNFLMIQHDPIHPDFG